MGLKINTIVRFLFHRARKAAYAVVYTAVLWSVLTVSPAHAQFFNTSFFQQPNKLELLAGLAGTSGSTDGTGSAARFYNPIGIAVDSADNIYVAEYSNHTIRKITSAGVVSTQAGKAGDPGNYVGFLPARLTSPFGVAIQGNKVFVSSNNAIWYFVSP